MNIKSIAQHIQAETIGEPPPYISGIASLDCAKSDQISFLSTDKYKDRLLTTKAGVVILSVKDADLAYAGCKLLVKDSYLAFAQVSTLFHPPKPICAGIHPSVVVAPSAQIAQSAQIDAQVVIGEGAIIGEQVLIGAGSVVEQGCQISDFSRISPRVSILAGSQIGQYTIIHSGSVIGDDGFGYANDGEKFVKIPQVGRVLIGDFVEIGSNTTVDRGALGNTVIGDGVKLDNQIQIAHNVQIGANTAIAGSSAVAGSTKIGKRCQIAGACAIVGHIEIADDTHITAQSLVTKSTKAGVYSASWSATEIKKWQKMVAHLRRFTKQKPTEENQ